MSNNPNSGENPEREAINEEVNVQCPSCKAPTVTLLELILIEGSLQNYHLMHTEVDEVLECSKCQHKWTRMVYL